MSKNTPQYAQGKIIIPLEDGRSFKVTPQECWQLSESIRTYLFDNYYKLDPIPTKTVEKNGETFRVATTEHSVFWRKLEKGRWEPHTFEIFDKFLSQERIFLDIGGWIGPTALYAARSARRVYAFEPDPLAYRELETNVKVNQDMPWISKLHIYNKAVAATSGTLKLGSRKQGGDSMSSTLFADQDTSWSVEAITLQQFIEAEKLQGEKLFIKIDIEGGEYELIPALREVFPQYDVQLYLSVHPFFLTESPAQTQVAGIVNRFSQRFAFVKHQLRLIRSLPFRYLYDIHGQPVNRFKQMLKAVVSGDFIHEIIATNTPWRR